MTGVINTTDNTNLVRQEVYSQALLKALDDWTLGRMLYNDRTGEFGDGDELKITLTGKRALQDYIENSPVDFSNMDTQRISLFIDKYYQDGFSVTEKFMQDAWQYQSFWEENMSQSLKAFERQLETDVLAIANNQTLSDPNTIASNAHRRVGTGSDSGTPAAGDRALQIEDFARMALAFDEALVPVENRVAIITPFQSFQLDKLLNVTEVTNGSNFNFDFEGLVQTGFGDKLNVRRNIHGFNVVISHYLPVVGSETIDAADGTGSLAITAGKANIFMSMASATDMPFMGALRSQPTPSYFDDMTKTRSHLWSVTGRWGFAIQRPQSLGVILTTK